MDAHKSLTASIAFAVGSLMPDLQVLFVGVAENDRTVSGNRHRKISSTGNNAVAPHFAFIIGSRFRQIKLGKVNWGWGTDVSFCRLALARHTDYTITTLLPVRCNVHVLVADCRNRHKIEPPARRAPRAAPREEHNTSFICPGVLKASPPHTITSVPQEPSACKVIIS